MREDLLGAPGERGRDALTWSIELMREEPALALGLGLAGALAGGFDWPSRIVAAILLSAYPSAVVYVAAVDVYAGRDPDPSRRVRHSVRAALTLLAVGVGVGLVLTTVALGFASFGPLVLLFVGVPVVAYLTCRTILALPAAAVDGHLPIASLRRGWRGFGAAPEDVAVVTAVVTAVALPAAYGTLLVDSRVATGALGVVVGLAAAVGQGALAHLYIKLSGEL